MTQPIFLYPLRSYLRVALWPTSPDRIDICCCRLLLHTYLILLKFSWNSLQSFGSLFLLGYSYFLLFLVLIYDMQYIVIANIKEALTRLLRALLIPLTDMNFVYVRSACKVKDSPPSLQQYSHWTILCPQVQSVKLGLSLHQRYGSQGFDWIYLHRSVG